MRSHVVRVLSISLWFVIGSVLPLHAQETPKEPADSTRAATTALDYFTVSAGWAFPVGGPVEESYESGLTIAASFRTGVLADYLTGFEVGYTWHSLDTAGLASANPGSAYSGGDMGLLSITTENDYLFGTAGKAMRPFVNLGLGYYKSFIDDATVTTGSTPEAYSTGVYEGSFFGFHAGVGALVSGARFGLRLDVNYNYLFAGGPNLESFTTRGGLVFYM